MNIDIRQGDVLDVLRTMPSESVHCVITSPPYYGLRDYSTGTWEGGDADCNHAGGRVTGSAGSTLAGGKSTTNHQQEAAYGRTCGKCGATRIDKQIGLEDTPDAYLQRMVEVFREVRRVLRSDGQAWVNMGDSYAGGPTGSQGGTGQHGRKPARTDGIAGIKHKDLLMMPARLALALQADGWWIRSDIIWAKRAPMPESVTDRPTSAHEHIFLLTKAARYFYDADAVREDGAGWGYRVPKAGESGFRAERYQNNNAFDNSAVTRTHGGAAEYQPQAGRNQWSYWLLSPEPYPDAHFATFPTEIPRRCIKAGTSEHGVCGECGAPYRRVVERGEKPPYKDTRTPGAHTPTGNGKISGSAMQKWLDEHPPQTTGWAPTCAHTSAPVVPATVLDIFNGSGTTGLVALELGRHYIGIELNPQYVELTRKRLMSEMPLFAYQALEGAA